MSNNTIAARMIRYNAANDSLGIKKRSISVDAGDEDIIKEWAADVRFSVKSGKDSPKIPTLSTIISKKTMQIRITDEAYDCLKIALLQKK